MTNDSRVFLWEAEITGISDLLLNPMTEATLTGIRTGVAPQIDKDRSIEDISREKLLTGPDGSLGLPVTYLMPSFKAGGRSVKNGKTQVSTATTTTMYDFLGFEGEFFPFVDQEAAKAWKPDQRRGTSNAGTKKVAVAIVRPLIPRGWTIKVPITIDLSKVSAQTVKAVMDAAGSKVGVGDFRPGCGGPFGRYAITKMTCKKQVDAVAPCIWLDETDLLGLGTNGETTALAEPEPVEGDGDGVETGEREPALAGAASSNGNGSSPDA